MNSVKKTVVLSIIFNYKENVTEVEYTHNFYLDLFVQVDNKNSSQIN